MRQLKRSDSSPPRGALRQATTARPLSALDMTLAPSAGVYRSRMMARAHITPAPMATPCTVRPTISISIELARAHPVAATT